jgi:hypothetical protein
MNTRSKKALAAAGATLAVAAGAWAARSRPAARAREARRATPARWPSPPTCSDARTAAPAARSGKTLAQIAVAGRQVAGLENAIYTDVQTHLDRAVANGRLTKAQEQTLLTRLKSRPRRPRQPRVPEDGDARLGLRGPRPAPRSPPTRHHARAAPRSSGRQVTAQIATGHGKRLPVWKAAISMQSRRDSTGQWRATA